MESRVDNIIAHNNNTEGNSELIDIRTVSDGIVYGSAGAAVRELGKKIDLLSESEPDNFTLSDWIQGGISNSTGQHYSSANRISSEDFHLFSRSLIKLNVSGNRGVICHEYDKDKHYISSHGNYMERCVSVSTIQNHYYKFEIYCSDGILPENGNVLTISQSSIPAAKMNGLYQKTKVLSDVHFSESYLLPVNQWEQGGIGANGIYANNNRIRSSEYFDMKNLAGAEMSLFAEQPCVITFATYQLENDGTYTLVDNVNEDIGNQVFHIVKPLYYRFLIRNSNGLSPDDLPNFNILISKMDNLTIYPYFENYSIQSSTHEWFATDNRIAVRRAMSYPYDVFVRLDKNSERKIAFQYWSDVDTSDATNFISETKWSDKEYYRIQANHFFTFIVANQNDTPISQASVGSGVVTISDSITTQSIPIAGYINTIKTFMDGSKVQMASWSQGGLGDNGQIYSSSNRIYTNEYFNFKDFDGFTLRLSTNGYGITYHSYTYTNGNYTLHDSYSSTTVTKIDLPIDGNLYYRFALYLPTGMNPTTDADKLDAEFRLPYLTDTEADIYRAYNKLQSPWDSQVEEIQKIRNGNFTFAVQTDTHFDFDNSSQKNWSDIHYGNNLRLFAASCGFDFIANLGDLIEGYPTDTTEDTRKDLTEAVRRYCYPHACPVLLTVGNHDNSYIYANGNADLIIPPSELHDRIFKPISNTGNLVFPSRKANYYFCDFDDIRVIMLNTCDVENGSAPTGNEIYNISNEQVSWFSNMALNTDKDIIVMTHVGLISEMTDVVPTNADRILSALSSYSGNVIACMYGHMHRQASTKINGINHIGCTWIGRRAEVFIVDTQNRTITTQMIGVFDNTDLHRSFTY